MTKRPLTGSPEGPSSDVVKEASLPVWLKIVLSLLLALHVVAVIAPPFAMACRAEGSYSPFADGLFAIVRPYVGAMFLDHGYFFFAPNPGPTHLVDYKIEFADSRPPLEGRFPDLQTERPRLLYHRYFMMSEFLNDKFVLPVPPPEPTAPPLTATTAQKQRFERQKSDYAGELAAWKHRRRQYESLKRAFEAHLTATYGGESITLTRVEHRLAQPSEVELENKRLDDPDTYYDLPETLPFPPLGPRGETLRGALPAPSRSALPERT